MLSAINRLLFPLDLYKETKSPIQIYSKGFVKNFAKH